MLDARVRSGCRVGRNTADHPINRDRAGDRALSEQLGTEIHRQRTGQRASVEPQASVILHRGPTRAAGSRSGPADLERRVLLHGDGAAAGRRAGGICRHQRPRVDVDRTGAGVRPGQHERARTKGRQSAAALDGGGNRAPGFAGVDQTFRRTEVQVRRADRAAVEDHARLAAALWTNAQRAETPPPTVTGPTFRANTWAVVLLGTVCATSASKTALVPADVMEVVLALV